MDKEQITDFTSQVGKRYLLSRFGDVDFSTVSKVNKDVVKVISFLCEFYDTGTLFGNKEAGSF